METSVLVQRAGLSETIWVRVIFLHVSEEPFPSEKVSPDPGPCEGGSGGTRRDHKRPGETKGDEKGTGGTMGTKRDQERPGEPGGPFPIHEEGDVNSIQIVFRTDLGWYGGVVVCRPASR